jgi:L-asparaginase
MERSVHTSAVRTPSAAGDDAVLRVKVLSTGGTIEKIYSEADGSLRNRRSPLKQILTRLRLPAIKISHRTVMSKDSLEMTPEDRRIIAAEVRRVPAAFHAVLIVHGTDTLAVTGEHLHQEFPQPDRPIVLTGAMRPFEFRDTDAFQNVVEALAACRLAAPGVYVAMHGKVLRFPGVIKDHADLTFVKRASAAAEL